MSRATFTAGKKIRLMLTTDVDNADNVIPL